MVRTRGQLRAEENIGRGSYATTSSDSEVSFNPNWLDTVFLGSGRSETDHEQDSYSEPDDMAADRQERLIQLLESAVMGMNEKFNELLSAFNSEPTRQLTVESRHDAPPRQGAGRIPAGRHFEESRPTPLDPRASTTGCGGRRS